VYASDDLRGGRSWRRSINHARQTAPEPLAMVHDATPLFQQEGGPFILAQGARVILSEPTVTPFSARFPRSTVGEDGDIPGIIGKLSKAKSSKANFPGKL